MFAGGHSGLPQDVTARAPADILEDILGYFVLLEHHSDKK
jgi:hypothetical protein